MKEAQDLRAGNCVKINNNLFIILKAIYNKGARGASSVKMKLKNLATGSASESVYRASDKFEDIVLERRQMQYLYRMVDSILLWIRKPMSRWISQLMILGTH
jgi:elongation factor P